MYATWNKFKSKLGIIIVLGQGRSLENLRYYLTGWCCYCYGKSFWDTIVEAKKDNEDGSDCTSGDDSIQDHNKPSSAFNDLADGQKPLTSIITQLKQTELVSLLELQISWVELVGILREDQGLWIYSLMTALDKPPHPDVTR